MPRRPAGTGAAAREELARAALAEITRPEYVGALLDEEDADGVLTLRFATLQSGYPDWRWTVSLAELEPGAPSVLEAELLPAEGALLAPDWVPWSERLEEYRAAQAAAGLGEEDEPDADEEESDEDEDPDEDDEVDVDYDGPDPEDVVLDAEDAEEPASGLAAAAPYAPGVDADGDEEDDADAEPGDGDGESRRPRRRRRSRRRGQNDRGSAEE